MTTPAASLAQGFPVLEREGLVYLDSAATSQTPQPVIDAMDAYYREHRATVHRSVYPLAAEATEMFEGARVHALVGLGDEVAAGLRCGPLADHPDHAVRTDVGRMGERHLAPVRVEREARSDRVTCGRFSKLA